MWYAQKCATVREKEIFDEKKNPEQRSLKYSARVNLRHFWISTSLAASPDYHDALRTPGSSPRNALSRN